MAGGISDTAANKFYNAITGKGTWTAVDPWISLSTANASDDNGTGIVEFANHGNGNGTRLQTTGTWTLDNNSGAQYDTEIDFGTATGASGTIVAAAFWNAATLATGTQFEGWTTVPGSKSIANGDIVKILTGLINIDFASGKAVGLHLLDAAINKAVAAWVGTTTWTAVTNGLYCGLLSAVPDDEGAGAVEVTGVFTTNRVNMLSASWTTPSSGSGNYNAILDWGTASGATGTADILGYGIYDAASAGNLLAYRGFTNAPIDITIGDTFEIAAGQIVLDCQG